MWPRLMQAPKCPCINPISRNAGSELVKPELTGDYFLVTPACLFMREIVPERRMQAGGHVFLAILTGVQAQIAELSNCAQVYQ
jgi:hypothetical protein